MSMPRIPSLPAATKRANKENSSVLRLGETMESLFCLSAEADTAIVRQCQAVLENKQSNVPSAWLRILKYSVKHSERSKDLIRLHRRATTVLKRLSSSFRFDEEENLKYLQVWLAYAEVQAKFGDRTDDARRTFRFIRNEGIGPCVKFAAYYISHAMFELSDGNLKLARNILREGLKNRASPVVELENKLIQLEKTLDRPNVAGPRINESSNQTPNSEIISPPMIATSHNLIERNEVDDVIRQMEQNTNNGSCSLCSSDDDDEISFNSLEFKKDDSILVRSTIKTGIELTTKNGDPPQTKPAKSSISVDALAKRTTVSHSNDIKTNPKIYASTITDKKQRIAVAFSSSTKTTTPSSKSSGQSSHTHFSTSGPNTPTLQSINNSSTGKSKFMNKSLVTKSLLGRRRLGGGAIRVNPSDAAPSLEDKKPEKPVKKRKPAMITKSDLSYMLNWDPTARKGDSSKGGSSSKLNSPELEKIDEEMSMGTVGCDRSHASSACTTNSTDSSAKIQYSTTFSENRPTEEVETKDFNQIHKDPLSRENEVMFEAQKIRQSSSSIYTPYSAPSTEQVAMANNDFLHLVSESNIIRVNDSPFCKLGVIGRGASCKVYRVLSKDYSVMALKRVKLDGMKNKEIDGYANEIALLKRLRGNPSIIQMFDSEVDRARKAIFVVMEAGEIDLNHVLQQQAKVPNESKSSSLSSLNINFIRLTWQQMLGAVYSIHEERIIHGDLKPANFLFVRGALKLIDFGIAKAIQSDDTTNIYRENTIGTLNYMAPEAILESETGSANARVKLGRASDIWSLGCILYQMVYGQTPFASLKNMIRKLRAIIDPQHEIPFPSEYKVDSSAVDAIKQCLQRNPDNRPPIVSTQKHQIGLLNSHCFLHSG